MESMTFGFEDMQRDMLKDMPAQTYRNLTPQKLANQAPPPSEGSDQEFWKIAATVTDTEVPVLSITDLGILRAATSDDGTPCSPSFPHTLVAPRGKPSPPIYDAPSPTPGTGNRASSSSSHPPGAPIG